MSVQSIRPPDLGVFAAGPPDAGTTIDMREVFAAVLRRRRWLVLSPALLLIIAVAFLLLRTPDYTATTQLLIDPRGLQVVDRELTPATQLSEAGMAIVESQMRVVASEQVLKALVDKEHLDQDPEFTESSGLIAWTSRAIGAALGGHREPASLRAFRELQRSVAVQRGEKNYIVDVSVTTEDPTKSARLADALASLYIETDFSARNQAAQKVGASLTSRLAELREQVRSAEEKIEAFKAENNIVGASGNLISDQQLSELSGQLVVARARTAEMRVRSEQIDNARRGGLSTDSIAEAVQSSTITQLRAQIAEVRRRQSVASETLGPRHPETAMMASQVRALLGQVREELTRIAQAARTDFERAQANEASLSASLDEMKTMAVNTRRAFVRLRELEREGEASRNVYEAFLNRVKEVGEQQAVDTANARVISNGVPPVRPDGPPKWLILAGALITGLGLGGAGGLLRDQLAAPVRSRRHLATAFGLPILATLPRPAASPDERNSAGRSSRWLVAALRLDPRSTLALRRLCQIVGEPRNQDAAETVLVTSPTEFRQSPSTASLQLAAALSQAGKRVLFLDGRPPIAAGAADANRPGFSDVVRSRLTLARAVVPDVAHNIAWVSLGSVTQAASPTALELRRVLRMQTGAYDVVVMDGGSVRANPLTAALADVVDHIIIAVEGGLTAVNDIEAEVEALSSQGERLRGLTFTVNDA